jgi:hypothetical protein
VDRPHSVQPVISIGGLDGELHFHDLKGEAEDDEWSLIEVKEKTQCPHCGQEMEKSSTQKRRLEFWANIYLNNEIDRWTWKEDADKYAEPGRLARKKVVIEYSEGEYDE